MTAGTNNDSYSQRAAVGLNGPGPRTIQLEDFSFILLSVSLDLPIASESLLCAKPGNNKSQLSNFGKTAEKKFKNENEEMFKNVFLTTTENKFVMFPQCDTHTVPIKHQRSLTSGGAGKMSEMCSVCSVQSESCSRRQAWVLMR